MSRIPPFQVVPSIPPIESESTLAIPQPSRSIHIPHTLTPSNAYVFGRRKGWSPRPMPRGGPTLPGGGWWRTWPAWLRPRDKENLRNLGVPFGDSSTRIPTQAHYSPPQKTDQKKLCACATAHAKAAA
jgi:hypothetical protein